MTSTDLYQRLVLEHSRSPRHFAALARCTHAAEGINPLCGDTVHVELCIVDARIVQIGFRGAMCAIARATASLLGEYIQHAALNEFDAIQARFARRISGDASHDAMLGDLNALAALARYPARRKCALLPFATVHAALAGVANTTTEGIRR